MGQEVAQTFDFKLGAQWIWGAVGLCWGSLVLYSITGALALRWTNPPAPQPTGEGRVLGWQHNPATCLPHATSC